MNLIDFYGCCFLVLTECPHSVKVYKLIFIGIITLNALENLHVPFSDDGGLHEKIGTKISKRGGLKDLNNLKGERKVLEPFLKV